MQLRIVNRTHVWSYTLAVVLVSVALSQTLLQVLYLWLGEAILTYQYMSIAAALMPALVALPVAYAMATLSRSLTISQQSLTTLAETDGLTGLINRRCFFERAEVILASAYRNQTTVTLLVLDADHFKSLNDTYGHACGDAALRFIADVFAAVARRSDLTGRLGGEEFAVLAPGLDPEEAARMAQRLVEAVTKAPLLHEASILELSVSCGYADTSVGYDFQTLFKTADQAMYQAKSAGRNRAVRAA